MKTMFNKIMLVCILFVLCFSFFYNVDGTWIGGSKWGTSSYGWATLSNTIVEWEYNNVFTGYITEIHVACGNKGTLSNYELHINGINVGSPYLETPYQNTSYWNYGLVWNISNSNMPVQIINENITFELYVPVVVGMGGVGLANSGVQNDSCDKDWDMDALKSGTFNGIHDGSAISINPYDVVYSINYTGGIYNPSASDLDVNTTDATLIEENTARLNGILFKNNSDPCTVRFEYGLTASYGINTSNETKTTNCTFNSDISSLSEGQLYHFRAYCNNTTASDYGVDKTFLTKPDVPTDSSLVWLGGTSVLLGWNKGDGANNTIIIRKTGSMPSNINDGTVVYNNTGNYTTTTIVSGQTTFFKAWSYSEWDNLHQFSDNGLTFVSSGLYVYCYDETNGSALTFNVSVFDDHNNELYSNEDCTNPYQINLTEINPNGLEISIIVSADGYNSRTYYATIYPNAYLVITAYLLPKTISKTYFINVIDEYLYPVDNASVTIKGYINSSSSWENLTTLLTDGYGQCSATLKGDVDYKVIISKTGYITGYFDWHTDPDNYGIAYPKIFKIYSEEYEQPPEYNNRTVSFDVTMLVNGSLFLEHNSSICGTNTVQIYIYEHLNYTTSLNGTYGYTTCNYSFYHSPINTSRMYTVYFYQNFTDTLNGNYFYVRTVMPLGSYDYNASYIEKEIENVYGPWGPGYVNFFLLFLPFVIIIVFVGYVEKGLAAIIGGFYLAFANSKIEGLGLINIYEISAFCVAIGLLLFLVYWRRGKT